MAEGLNEDYNILTEFFSQLCEAPRPKPGLPGNVISFHIVPLDPTRRAGLAGHIPAKQF